MLSPLLEHEEQVAQFQGELVLAVLKKASSVLARRKADIKSRDEGGDDQPELHQCKWPANTAVGSCNGKVPVSIKWL